MSTTGGVASARLAENRELAKEDKRRCPRCNLVKRLDEYNRVSKVSSRVHSWCKSCHREAQGFNEHPHADLIKANRSLIPQQLKHCLVCREIKPYEDFYKFKGIGGRHPWCKACIGRKARMEKYGLTLEEVFAAEAVTHCEVCSVTLDTGDTGTERHFDHDHETGKYRGILCERCNVALGLMRDDAQIIEKMASYVRRARAA